jgi:hypothetical protein
MFIRLAQIKLVPLCLFAALSCQPLFPTQSHAEGIIETGPFAGLGSIAAYVLCRELGGGSAGPGVCARIALLVDPPARGITDVAIALQYNAAQFAFDLQNSGFVTPFAINSDNPPVVAREGTLPLDLLPSSGFTPGQPLPGSSVTLTDTGTVVSLSYHLSTPVTIDSETNLFLIFVIRLSSILEPRPSPILRPSPAQTSRKQVLCATRTLYQTPDAAAQTR